MNNEATEKCVNALSGCYLISTENSDFKKLFETNVCQCPLGLLPHFYRNILLHHIWSSI